MRTIEKIKIGLAASAIAAVSLTLVACGSSSGSDADAGSDSAAQSAPGGAVGGPFASLTSDDIKCLEDQGVTMPTPPADGEVPQGAPEADGAGPPGGMTGTSGATSPQGSPPQGMPGGNPEEMLAAFEACDIDIPQPGSSEMPPGAPGADAGTATESGTSSSGAPAMSTQQS